jgi:Tol biopolymer transport system component
MKRIILAILIVLAAANAYALNKFRWKQMDWYILETEHFYIYYYKGEDFLARLASVYAEQAYSNDTSVVRFIPKTKIPLFVYADNLDFTSTNITLSYLGEGVGGFTEAYKNRVVLPNTGSLKAFRQVIFHETTHALQYDIMFGEGIRSYNALYKELFVPTWLMEGMAEYDADDKGTEGDMVLRDAVINERLIPLSSMDAFDHLDEQYLAYKEAESMFDYISRKYGRDKPGKFVHYFEGDIPSESLFKKVLNMSEDDFWKEFQFYLKKKYWAQVQGRDSPDKYGPRLTVSDHTNPVYNQAPEFSPDGNTIAYLSTAGGNRDLYVMKSDGKESRSVFTGFEGINTDGFPLSWAQDNKTIYFASRDKGRMFIYRGNIMTGSAEKVDIPGMNNVYSPAISPDGRYLAFIGNEHGFTDVYIYDIAGNKVTNITSNIFENNFESWSPDGNRLIFTEERDNYRRIALYDLKTGAKKFLTKPVAYDYEYPRFIDNNEIMFTSDKTGIFNLYKMDLTKGAETQLTNVISGVYSPSLSKEFIAYNYYEDSCQNIYKYMRSKPSALPEIPLMYVEGLASEEDKKSPENPARPAPKTELNPDKYSAGDDEFFKRSVEDQAKAIVKSDLPYVTTLTPDLILGILGFSSDTGIVGGGYFTMSDMLGNHNFSLVANFVPGYYSQFDLSYLYMSLPFDFGFDIYFNQDVYQLYDVDSQTFFSQLNSTQIGGSISIKYPFTMFTDLTLQIGTSKISDRYTDYTTSSTLVFPVNSDNILNTVDLTLTCDYSSWRDMWPYAGHYMVMNLEVADKVFGGTTEYNMYQIDIRKYFDLAFLSQKNMSLAFRLLAAMSDGPDRPYFLFGGLATVRGLSYGEYAGDKMGIFSSELRYTMARNLDFGLWPFNFIMIKNIKIALFNDMGLVRDDYIRSITNEELKNGLGISLVFDTFLLQRQYTPLKFEVAKRTDVGGDIWNFYFSVATNF